MIKFSLIENALDSLEHAIEHLTAEGGPSPLDHKRVIIDVAHVVELLLKERLRMIHPSFVFENIDKYTTLDAHTVSSSKAVTRLEKLGSIEFDESDKQALKIIRDTRNNIEHYEFKFNEKESRAVIGSVLVFIFKFSLNELGLDWSDRRINDPKWIKLKEYAGFFEAQKQFLFDSIDIEGVCTIECSVCHVELFDVEAEVCLLCGYREDVVSCARCHSPFLGSTTEREEGELCPECERKDGYAAANFDKY